MNSRAISLLNNEEIDAILTARCDDVFSRLGMHEHPTGKGLIARVFLPGAAGVDVIASKDNKKVASLALVDEVGLFEGPLGRRRKPFAYHLRVDFGNDTVVMEDPYRFPSLLNDDDVYLFGEGTQERLYQWMGAHPRQIDGVDGTSFVIWAPDAGRVSVSASDIRVASSKGWPLSARR